MKSQIIWLRVAYWAGAIADGLALIPMLNMKVAAFLIQSPTVSPGWDFRYASAFGAALMAGWTVLLIWADRKPMERRGVMVITIFPVLSGITLSRYFLYLGGYAPEAFPLQSLILPIFLTVLYVFAYVNSFRSQRAVAAT